jgi:hypothetical protein
VCLVQNSEVASKQSYDTLYSLSRRGFACNTATLHAPLVSESVTLRLTVRQHFLVSSPFRDYDQKVAVLSLWGALSDERPSLSFASLSL